MDSELLLKFIRYFPDYLSALSRKLSRFLDNLCRNYILPSLLEIYKPAKSDENKCHHTDSSYYRDMFSFSFDFVDTRSISGIR